MKIIESIKKARERGFNDKEILEKIEKQNPEKRDFLEKAKNRGANPSEILDEIIRQNSFSDSKVSEKKEEASSEKKEEKNISQAGSSYDSPRTEKGKENSYLRVNPLKEERKGKTVLSKEAQEREERLRENFLKRIEEKIKEKE